MAAIGPAPSRASTFVHSDVALSRPMAVRISSLNAEQILFIAQQIVETMIHDLQIDPLSRENRKHFVKYMLPVVQETLTRSFAVPRQFLEKGLQFALAGENSLVARVFGSLPLKEAPWKYEILDRQQALQEARYSIVLPQAEFCQKYGCTAEWKKLASSMLYVMSLEIRRVQPDANKLYFDLQRPYASSTVTVEEK